MGRKYALALLFLLGTTLLGFTQTELIDSLEKKIEQLNASPSDSTFWLWLSHYDLFGAFVSEGAFDKAEHHFRESIKNAPNDTFRYRSYYRLAVQFSEKHQAEKSMEIASEMLDKFSHWPEVVSQSYMFMAIAHEHKKDVKSAIDYYQKSMSAAIESGDSGTYYMVMGNMANTLVDQGNKKEAIDLYKQALSYYEKQPGSLTTVLSLMNNIGSAYMQENSDSVFKYLNRVIVLGENSPDPWYKGMAGLNLGLEYFFTGNPELSETNFKIALEVFNEFDEIYYHYEIYRYLGAIQSSRKNWQEAQLLFDSSKYYSDKLNNLERNEEFARAKAEFGLAEEELRNELLTREKQEAENLIRWQWITGGAIALLFMISLGFVASLYKQSRRIKKLNKALALKNEELDSFLQEKDNLMGILFHDIRSPMAAIKTVADFIEFEDNQNLDEETTELLVEMKKVSEQGLKLVDNIWAIYELENKSLNINLTEVELDELFEEIKIEFEGMSKVKKIDFSVLPSPNIYIPTHKDLLLSVLRNLVSNAFKFSPSGSKVEMYVTQDQNKVEIHIKDQGPGFSREDQQKMFKKFQKLSAQPQHGEKSSGLGLYLVSLIANKIKAEISLNKKYTEGAEFIVCLPYR